MRIPLALGLVTTFAAGSMAASALPASAAVRTVTVTCDVPKAQPERQLASIPVHALQGLRDFADAVSLGIAVDDDPTVADRSAIYSAPRLGRTHSAVRAVAEETRWPDGALHISRPGGLCVAQAGTADPVRVAASTADASGFLQAGKGCGRLIDRRFCHLPTAIRRC